MKVSTGVLPGHQNLFKQVSHHTSSPSSVLGNPLHICDISNLVKYEYALKFSIKDIIIYLLYLLMKL